MSSATNSVSVRSQIMNFLQRFGIDVLGLIAAGYYVVTSIVSIQKDIEYMRKGIDEISASVKAGDSSLLQAIKERDLRIDKLKDDVANSEREISRIEGKLQIPPLR